MRRVGLLLAFLTFVLTTCSPVTVPTPTPTPSRTATIIPSPTPLPTDTPTPTTTSTPKPTSTSTPTPVVVGNLAFHDYNGNGIQDAGEPTLQGIVFKYTPSNATCTTDESGKCNVNVPIGSYSVLASDPSGRMRYRNVDACNFSAITTILRTEVKSSGHIFTSALMEGFLTSEVPQGIPIFVDRRRGDYYDHDSSMDMLWWYGEKLPAPRPHDPPNAHTGTDDFVPIGTQVLVAAPGTVNGIFLDGGHGEQGISITHSEGWKTTVWHVSKFLVKQGDRVCRGQSVALSGDTGSPGTPHNHFQLERWMPCGRYFVDPYKPVVTVPRGSWFCCCEKEPSLALSWRDFPAGEDWAFHGYWTKLNDPIQLQPYQPKQ